MLVKGDAGRWRACKSSPTGQLDDPSVSPESRPRDPSFAVGRHESSVAELQSFVALQRARVQL